MESACFLSKDQMPWNRGLGGVAANIRLDWSVSQKPQKPRRKQAYRRAVGAKSRVLQRNVCFCTAAPLLGQSFLPPLGRRGDSGPGGGLLCNAGEPEIRTYGSPVLLLIYLNYLYMFLLPMLLLCLLHE